MFFSTFNCQQKHDPSFVDITKHCELSISLLTRRRTLKFRLTIRYDLMYHCIIKTVRKKIDVIRVKHFITKT